MQDKFQTFKSHIKLNLDVFLRGKSILTVATGDFNGKSKDWCWNNMTRLEGSELYFLTSQFSLFEIIKELTQIVGNSKYFIHSIFTSQQNMTIDYGVHPSLHSNCHHQIIYAKFDLKPTLERTVCKLLSYQKSNWHIWLGICTK